MRVIPLKPEEFDTHIREGTFRLAFVGMSNVGKSYRSKVLQKDCGFLWYHVDEEIQKELGFKTMTEISEWLGYPTGTAYTEREAEYLALENKYTRRAAMQTGGKNLVFDTTGSVVHLPQKTLDTLRENCLVVHLGVGEDSIERMTKEFFRKPKPVAWCGFFSRETGEPEVNALRRSYPILLEERLARYRRLAHVNISTLELRDKSGAETLAVIRQHLF